MIRTARPKGRGGQLGFSLLELLLVLGILAVALAVVAPSFNRARSKLTVRSAAFELASHLRAARAAASAQSVQKALVFDLVTRKYWAEGAVHPRTISQSVQISLNVPDSERTGRTGRIRFLPDGSASGGSVILHDGRAHWSVIVDWLSGDVRVFSGS